MTGSPHMEIDAGSRLCAMTFTENGEYLVGSDWERVRVWRAKDGKHMKTMETGPVFCLAVSKNGRWMAAGTISGNVVVWDATTYKEIFTHREDMDDIHGVDFSPASARLVAASRNGTATVFDFMTRKQVQILRHEAHVIAARYSPHGDQIATGTPASVRVWDSDDARLLAEIPVPVTPLFNTSLGWFRNTHLLVASDGKIKKFDASTASLTSEWPAPHMTDRFSSIALPRHLEFVVCATDHTLTFWDTSTLSQLPLVTRPSQSISSIARSPSDRLLAICGGGGTITIKSLSHVADPIPLSRLRRAFQELDIQIDDATLDAWKHDQLANAEALLTAAIPDSGAQNTSNHVLATRALLRARLGHWDEALIDAEMTVDVQPSAMGYIATSIAHIGMGKKHEAYHACDIAFEHFRSSHGTFLLLIKAIIMSMAGEHHDAISRMYDLIAANPGNSIYYLVQAYMYLLLGNSLIEHRDYESAVQSFERARAQMRHYASPLLSVVSLISGWKFGDLGITIQQCLCETLYAAGRTGHAGESLLEMVIAFDEEVLVTKWISDFIQQCLSTPENDADTTRGATRRGTSTLLLRVWAKTALTSGKWKDALLATANFAVPKVTIYQTICERLEMIDHVTDAVECFHQMRTEMGGETNLQGKDKKWDHDFRQRSFDKLQQLGDTAAGAQQYDDAISHYTSALSLHPVSPQDILIKRGKACIASGSWNQALEDADRVITLDQSSPWGYEMKHAALHEAGDYDNAVEAFKTMLSKMNQSDDRAILQHQRRYKTPTSIEKRIRRIVKRTIRDSPHILINTKTGKLYNRDERESLFESQPIFNELVSSMTTRIDRARIKREVRQYFQYVVLSHRWEKNEPSFQHVVHVAVYDLKPSTTHNKLRMFCELALDARFNWAWSDTCCINKLDHFVLQESLVAMFKWYEGSALMIVFLRGVHSGSRRGALAGSVWNTRGWTLQEYIAAKNVRFYTENWTLYQDLPLSNHKESLEVISEMEEVTGVSIEHLKALRPGLTSIREKLRLASTRETTRVEDAAYSLLGIFSAVGISVIYGEGRASLGRLLANVLTRSGDASILAWTGEPGRFNSCLPARIIVFKQPPTSHLPPPIQDTALEQVAHDSSFDIDAALILYDLLHKLPTPRFAESRMTLPCIAFQIPSFSSYQTRAGLVYRTRTDAFGTLEIRTKYDLSQMGPLYLVHPWLDTLLEREAVPSGTFVPDGVARPPSPDTDDGEVSDEEFDEDENTADETIEEDEEHYKETDDDEDDEHDDDDDWEPETPSHPSPMHHIPPVDREMHARRLVARLRQPFGGLLLVPTGQRMGDYKRVAADSVMKARFRGNVSLSVICEHVCQLDVL